MNKPAHSKKDTSTGKSESDHKLFGQSVLVLQGGGALGAYQAGVYQAMHEAGIEPDWVIGTSIGAINGAIISGNKPEHRLTRLREFWDGVEQQLPSQGPLSWLGLTTKVAGANTILQGIPSFFRPNPAALLGVNAKLGVDQAAYYTTEPLRETLTKLVDFDYLREGKNRLTVGAVHVQSGDMRYFDSREECLAVEHVMASGALPPGFPAVRVNGEPYWDGGLYSNTPIEAVLDDNPRRDSTIFAVNVWQQIGEEPESIWEVMGREKEITYASRSESHIERQKQIHKLRRIIRELQQYIPEGAKSDAQLKELTSWGCGTTMHVLRLVAPRVADEDQNKDIDFSSSGIHARWHAGYVDAKEMIERAPWTQQSDGIEGIIQHFPQNRNYY